MIALPPDYVRYIVRNGEDNDCTVAAIALATGETYEEVLAAAIGIQPKVLVRGLFITETRKTLTKLGWLSKVRKKFDIERDTGILMLEETKSGERHSVYLWAGRIVEPSMGRRALWLGPDAYLAHEKSFAVSLIEITKESA